MNIFERSFISIYRQKRKYIFLLFLAIVLINLIIGGISIRKAITGINNIIEQKIDISATILSKINDETEYLRINHIHDVGQLPYVDKYNYNIYLDFETITIDKYQQDEADFTENVPIHFVMKGVNDSSFLEKKDIEKIIDGRLPNEKDNKRTIMISDKISAINNLSVGDTINLKINTMELVDETYRLVANNNVLDTQEYDFEIVGVYSLKINDNFGNENFKQILTLNESIIDIFEQQLATYSTYYSHDSSMLDKINSTIIGQYETEFLLKNWNEREIFTIDANQILPNGNAIYLKTSVIEEVIEALDSMDNLSILILFISIISSTIIIIGVFLLFIKGRKREFGILIAIGENKIKVVLQLVLEVLFIIWLALGISVFTGDVLSTKLVDTVAKQEVLIMGETLQLDMTIDEIYVLCKLLPPEYVGQLLFGSSLMVFIAVLGPALIILRLTPRKIML